MRKGKISRPSILSLGVFRPLKEKISNNIYSVLQIVQSMIHKGICYRTLSLISMGVVLYDSTNKTESENHSIAFSIEKPKEKIRGGGKNDKDVHLRLAIKNF